ncbi:hypothetical protein PSHT_15908 [Puccinia striiformis]|uniref:Uncharacterized protein n=1 Tax=Puccinia striiformis TaxID=27350 RepID=A0A2S4UCI5_9BASI|nr:hypothetical protein PSHT_15908 [Puccinia striiformis]
MLLLTKILVALQLLHLHSVSAYPTFVAKDLVKRTENILGEVTSHHRLPETGPLIPEELKSLSIELFPLGTWLLMIVACCFAAPGGEQEIEGLSLEKYTSGNVGHQEKPVGIDDSETLNQLHGPKVETETGVERGEQASASSIPEEVKGTQLSKKQKIEAQFNGDFNYYKRANGEE